MAGNPLCEYCGKSFSARNNLSKHLRNVHNIECINGGNECKICDKSFSVKSSLNRHIKDVHGLENEIAEPKAFKCTLCERSYKHRKDLYHHMRTKHSGDVNGRAGENQADESGVHQCCSDKSYKHQKDLNYHIRTKDSGDLDGCAGGNQAVQSDLADVDGCAGENQADQSDEVVKLQPTKCHLCSQCGKMFSTISNLKKHLHNVHNIEEIQDNEGSSLCPLCDIHVSYGADLSSHLKGEHNIQEEVAQHIFGSMEDFLRWKEKIENETLTRYMKPRGSKKLVEGSRHYYICHRSGAYRPQGKGLRLRNIEKCIKIGKPCPSQMKVTECENIVKVSFHMTHLGHVNSVEYLKLSKQDRDYIAGKLKNGVPKHQILNEVRDGAPRERLDALDMKDIYNVIRDYNLDLDRAHKDDPISVELWVQQQRALGEDCPVIYYKGQGSEDQGTLGINDFMVVVMTPFQKKLMGRFGLARILIDSTHGTNTYDFQLTTLLTVDEFGGGVPVAYCLSNSIDQLALESFFSAVKRAVGQSISTEVFMSDDFPAYFNAWCSVMDVPQHHLLCIWHVLKAWKVNLSKIKDFVQRTEMWQALLVLLDELDIAVFKDLLLGFLQMCAANEEVKQFGDYFAVHYAPRPEMWAFCYRKGLRLNTNMYLEALHKKLKYCYLDGKVNRRVDKCMAALLRFSKDMLYERFIRLVKGKPTKRMQAIMQSHHRSNLIKVNMITKLGENIWEVQSSQPEFQGPYKVTLDMTSACVGCPLACHVCKVCTHQFTCTCPDHLIRGNFCKHIHACLRTTDVENMSNHHPLGFQAQNEKHMQLEEEIQTIANSTSSCGEKIGDVIDEGLKLHSILNMIIGGANKLGKDQLPSFIKAAERLLDEMQRAVRQGKEDSNAVLQLGNGVSRDPLTTPCRRLEVQPRFSSTKKKSEKQSVSLNKPTPSEACSWKSGLLDLADEASTEHISGIL